MYQLVTWLLLDKMTKILNTKLFSDVYDSESIYFIKFL